MKFKKYLKESKLTNKQIQKIKNEIKSLKSYMDKGKLKPEGKKRLETLEDMLFREGIFDF